MTTKLTKPPIDSASVPAEALQFASPMQFGEHDTDENFPNVFPVTFFARSAEPIQHPWWGRIVHDMDGMTSEDTISIDFNHDTMWSDIGFCDRIDASHDGLKLGGGLISLQKHDQAWNVYHKGKLGFPWKSSIDFTSIDPDELQFQWVDEFETTEVNGGTFEGPGYVVRKWPLLGVAITQRGIDPDANAQFSTRKSDTVSVNIFSEAKDPPTMADDNPKTTDTPVADNTLLSAANTNETVATDVKPPVVSGITSETLTKFSSTFGNEKGMEYLSAGLNFEAAQLQFARHRADVAEAKVTKAAQERDDLQTQLSAANDKLKQLGADLGQETPLETDETSSMKAMLFSGGKCVRKSQS